MQSLTSEQVQRLLQAAHEHKLEALLTVAVARFQQKSGENVDPPAGATQVILGRGQGRLRRPGVGFPEMHILLE